MWWKTLGVSEKINLIMVIITAVLVIITYFSVSHTIDADKKILEFSNESINLSNKSIDLSKQALCLQKDADYRDIAPPSIIVSLKEPPTVLKQQTIYKEPFQTAVVTFRFHIIPNSRTFFYPDSELDIANTIGLLANAALVNSTIYRSCGSPESGKGLGYPLDYRNESVGEVECSVTNYPLESGLNFSSYPPNFLIVNFTFQIKDGYEHKYSSNISYNISIQDTNIEDIRQFKAFDFKKPENYSC